MKTLFKCCASLILLGLLSCQNEEQKWFKGNLHTHTYWSDGDAFPEMVLDWYKSNGYDFVSLTDHNTLQQGEKWKKIPKSHIYQQAFDDYLSAYGTDWVEYSRDSAGLMVRLKTEEEYLPLFQDKDFLIMRGLEITDSYNGKPLHMNATNVKNLIEPRHGNSVAEVLQNNINAVLEQREATGQPIMPHINHPNFGWAISLEDMIALKGERFFELFNGHPSVNNYGDSIRLSTEQMWDAINIAYLERGQPIMYGIATDDSHYYHQFGPQFSNSGRGWVMVEARELTGNAIVEAMEEGKFYASTGVKLSNYRVKEGTISLTIEAEEGVTYKTSLIGVRKGRKKAEVFAIKGGAEVQLAIPNDVLFVRTKIVSSRLKENPFEEGDFETAWTQPVVPQGR
ncbi:histidinol-phosphatase [Roseivirga sp. UBA1976]|uniref:PHP domain-containing protein n=1 Tax=Roseivirga sp. UBA1976 TaxID=1947386 RepID=UPI00257F30A3|nr:histidinol-phosphatase [Roseivirga sp. UBA1976]|tara:strand:+ start:3087 stop:4274 length:1188 start_codon:yes stop_codon:yes gene_type:complete